MKRNGHKSRTSRVAFLSYNSATLSSAFTTIRRRQNVQLNCLGKSGGVSERTRESTCPSKLAKSLIFTLRFLQNGKTCMPHDQTTIYQRYNLSVSGGLSSFDMDRSMYLINLILSPFTDQKYKHYSYQARSVKKVF